MKKLSLFFLALGINGLSFSQGNTCATAVAITPAASCSYTSGTTVGATYQSNAANGGVPGCASPGAPDVWYTFTAGVSGNFTIDTQTGTITDGGMAIYSGACGSLTQIACDDDSSPNGLMPMITASLTAGQTYYIRFWAYGGSNTGTFGICVTTPLPPPANDNCNTATPVTVPGSGCNSTSGYIAGATASPQATGCSGTADDDVWYSFVATSPSATINLNNVTGSTTDLYHSVYAGTCGSIGAPLVCSDPNNSTVTGLTPGNTYYVRVYSYTSTGGQTSSFDVCIQSAGICGTPATQDYCMAPALLTPGGGNFSSNTSGTYTSDTPGNLSSLFCGSIENNSWYQFTATATTATFNFSSVGGPSCSSGIQAEVYSVTHDINGCCTGFTSMSNCFNPGTASTGTVTATGLTIGNTYMLMVDGWGGSVCNFTVSNWSATGILGISLTNLSALSTETGNQINWTTETEKDNDYFILQRSEDGINFESIANIDGAGTKNSPTNYAYFDAYRLSGIVYYRLKSLDFSGLPSYSEMLSVDRNSNEDLTFYPNPASEQLNVSLNHTESVVMEMCSIDGAVISTHYFQEKGIETQIIPIHQLKQGLYILRFKGGTTAIPDQKFIKK